MEASVDQSARDASSVRRYPSSRPSRAVWSWGSRVSVMVRSTLHPERMRRQSEIPAFFGETVQFPGQEGEAGFFHQGHLPATAANIAEVYVHGDERLLVTRSFGHGPPPEIDDVRITPEN